MVEYFWKTQKEYERIPDVPTCDTLESAADNDPEAVFGEKKTVLVACRKWIPFIVGFLIIGAFCVFLPHLLWSSPALRAPQTPPPQAQSHRALVELQWEQHHHLQDQGNNEIIYVAHVEFCQEGNSSTFGYRQLTTHYPPKEESNPSSCGPAGLVIRLTPGQSYRLVLHNNANANNQVTNLHTHGLHIAGDGNADDITRTVQPGNCLVYHWDLPRNAMGGTFWIHPHGQGNAQEQLTGGAYGMLIVEDSLSLFLAKDKSEQEVAHPPLQTQYQNIQQWLQNELLMVVYTKGTKRTALYTPTTTTSSTSSQLSALELEQDVWYRLRLLTVDPKGERVPVTFPNGCQVHLAATDGMWLTQTPQMQSQQTFNSTGAGRLDLAIRCNALGIHDVLVHNHTAGSLHVIVPKSANTVLADPFYYDDNSNNPQRRSWKPNYPPHLADLLTASSSNDMHYFQTHTLTLINRTINDMSWDAQLPLLDLQDIPYNSYQEFVVRGSDIHPFHMHVYPVQTFDCGPHHIDGQFYDTIVSSSTDTTCRLRFRVLDYAQRIVLHCHNILHEDQGMIVWFNVSTTTDSGAAIPVQDATHRDEMICGNVPF
ncbi:Multicopper oxidase [Seminavis robusta]|uniref:Multicopper oxidase n=1 Tax=Seminavis robusta TaxID=568900 RepID=A0A9N8DE38_9STRA|nr:Multicopper oxidase [Seminavis robusta]|eukprot:Sro50_g029240.1 Multicopper oxidase (595) ;mRNA; r:125581-127365